MWIYLHYDKSENLMVMFSTVSFISQIWVSPDCTQELDLEGRFLSTHQLNQCKWWPLENFHHRVSRFHSCSTSGNLRRQRLVPVKSEHIFLPSKVVMKSNMQGLSFLLPKQIWCWVAVIDRSRQEMLPPLWEMVHQSKARAWKTAELFMHCKFITFKPFSWARNNITFGLKKEYDKGGGCDNAVLRINGLGLPGCKWESCHLSVS